MKLIFKIFALVISVVLFFVVIDPLCKEVKQLRSDVTTYNLALDNSTELQSTRDSLVEVYKGVKKEDKERLAHLLPSTISNIELILEIEKIANLHGMPIGDINFDTKSLESETSTTTTSGDVVVAETDTKSNLPYGIFPMEFVIEGRYDTFVEFLQDLEHNLRLVDVRSISFDVPNLSSTSGNTTDSNIYKYTLKVETYWLK
jgi:hypothetical protein